MDNLQLRDNPDKNRIEAVVADSLAVIEYWRQEDTIYYLHTQVPTELEGQGIASRMARFALELAREQGLKVVPRCPFVSAYIRRHPEYQDLVT